MTAAPALSTRRASVTPERARQGRGPSSTPPPVRPVCRTEHTWSAWRERSELRGTTIARYCLDCSAEQHKRRRR